MSPRAPDLLVRIRGDSDDLERAGKRAQAVFRRIQRRSVEVSRAARSVASGFAKISVATLGAGVAVGAFAQRGGRVQGVLNGFAQVTGDAEGALRKLREQTRGLVSDTDLITQFNQGIATGAARSVDEFGRLARVSQDLGRALGIDATEALEKFSIGLARQSKLRLDDLGITLDVARANERFARSVGVNVRALTDEQKALAFRQEAFAEAERLIDGFGGGALKAADQIARVRAQFSNFVDEVAKIANDSDFVADFADRVATFTEQVTTVLRSGTENSAAAFEALGGFIGSKIGEGLLTGFAASVQSGIDNNPFGIVRRFLGVVVGPAAEGLRGFAADARESADEYLQAFEDIAKKAAEGLPRVLKPVEGGGGESAEARLNRILGGSIGAPGAGLLGRDRETYFTRGFVNAYRRDQENPPVGLQRGFRWNSPDFLEGIARFREGLEPVNLTLQSMLRFGEQLEDQFTDLEAVGLSFAEGFSSALGSAVFDGVAAFQRFTDQVLRMLAQIAARMVVFRLLSLIPGAGQVAGAFGGAAGGSFGFAGIGPDYGATRFSAPVGAGLAAPAPVFAQERTVRVQLDLGALPPARDPRQAARDAEWLRFMHHTNIALGAQGG